MIYRTALAKGFTLAEIIVSTLLLSIFALGSFKAFHYAQYASNSALTTFLEHNQHNQRSVIVRLKLHYPSVHIDSQFSQLKCLFEQKADCPLNQ